MAEGMSWSVTDGDKLTQAEIYGEVLSHSWATGIQI